MSELTVRAILARQLSSGDSTQSFPDEANIRKEKVLSELDSDWARIYLNSPCAVIEMPKDALSNVGCAYNRIH